MLVKGGNGWTHKFWRDPSGALCKVCGEEGLEHVNMKQILELQRVESINRMLNIGLQQAIENNFQLPQ